MLFEPFGESSEKLHLQSLDILGHVYYLHGFFDYSKVALMEGVDGGHLKHLRISRYHARRTEPITLQGDWQDYRSIESLAVDGISLPSRGSSWDEISARLTHLSINQFISELGGTFSALRTLAMTTPISPAQLPIREIRDLCPLLEQLAYAQVPGLFTRDLPDLEDLPHLRRLYILAVLGSSYVEDYFARFMEYCTQTESNLFDRLDRFAAGATVCDIVTVRQLEWSLRLSLKVKEEIPGNEEADPKPYIPLLPIGVPAAQLPRQTTFSFRGKVLRELDWGQLKQDPIVDTVRYYYDAKYKC
ncbi:hypothetical protein ACJ72_06052 [Emergomyces africanus]|uniref:Uncharacterized protein n=1 Tax=Emergomyces africanus TaxID=1955775 RepID=A0A1B7NS62_9EURO|nr:hypothetical protein ACJ72_06052 [Emergomyces africanus]